MPSMDHEDESETRELKVGEVARRTGLTVRTLHHYHEIGLLEPSSSTAAGHRLYTTADLSRLQRIISLRQLGFSLAEIGECLERPDFAPARVVAMHLARLDEQIVTQRKLRDQLGMIAQHLEAAEEVSADLFLDTLEATIMLEKYYTPEQMEKLAARREELGEEGMEAGQKAWRELFAKVGAEMEKGTDPADPALAELTAEWQRLVGEFTGGDPGIASSLGNMYREEPDAPRQFGFDPKIFEYMSRAMAAQAS